MKRDISVMRTISAIRIATALAVPLGAAAAVAAQPAPTANAEVEIDQFAFIPQRITVKAGTTVTWVNEDDAPHTVASSSKLFKSKALDTQDKFSFTFMTPGTYAYFCSVHPHMTGTVVVEAASGADAAH
jgi:plastocyanin